MTFNSNRKAALAVTAGLVGALTLGGAAVVPQAAFAEEGAGTMSVQPTVQAKLENGRNGVAVEPKLVNGDKVVELAAGSSAYVNVSSVVDGDVNDYDFVYTVRNSSVSYVAPSILGGGSGVNQTNVSNYFDVSRADNAATIQARTKAGMRYKLDVYAKSDTTHAQSLYTVYFEYVAPEKVYTLTNSVDGSTTFTYDGKKVPVQVTDQDGNPVSVTFYDADGDKTSEGVGDAPVWAGKYTAKTGDGAVLPFTVDKLDLAKAEYGNVFFGNAGNSYGLTEAPTSADDFLGKVALSSGKQLKDIAQVSESDGWNKDDGVYTVTIVPSDSPEAAASVTGTGKVTYYVADKNLTLSSVFYGQVEAGLAGTVTVNGSEGQSFDASKLKVTGTDGKAYSGDALSIKYEKQNGANWDVVSASALKSKGSYRLTVTVKPVKSATDGDLHYNDTTVFVNVTGASLDADQTLTYTKDGKVVAGTVKTVYDGSDVLKTIAYEVKDSDGKVYKAGEDYTVTVKQTKKADGISGVNKTVDSIVDAGTYEITATGKTFEFTAGIEKLTVVVKPVKVTDLAKAELTYNGFDLEIPAAKYAVLDTDDNATGDYAELPAGVYSVAEVRFDKDADGKTVNKVVKAPNAAGTYTVRIGLTDKAGDNYVLADRDFTVTVEEYTPFEDVAPEAWYAKPVNDAAKQKYINGYGGTRLFMPNADITRAEAVAVLFNMAGGYQMDDDNFVKNEAGYDTGFSDVEGSEWYAKALAWAKACGVANGFGDGTFQPNAKLTREQFAGFLSNYAKAKGEYKAPSAGALDKVSDKGTVSSWATASVSWAVENGVMGNGGFVAGQSDVTRAEVAAMAVNYQPVKVSKPVLKPIA